MRLQRSLATLAATGALSMVLWLAPSSQAAEQGAQASMITISGTAVNPDGSPGAGLPVALKAPEKKPVPGDSPGSAPGLLTQGADKPDKPRSEGSFKVLAKGTTDAQGKFALKFQPAAAGEQALFLEIGDSTKSAWAKQSVVAKGKDIDLGNITLKAPAQR